MMPGIQWEKIATDASRPRKITIKTLLASKRRMGRPDARMKQCGPCKQVFEMVKPWQKFCSARCRWRAWKRRQG